MSEAPVDNAEAPLPALVLALAVACAQETARCGYQSENWSVRLGRVRTLPLTDAKARLSRLVAEVSSREEQVTITRRGRPAAVLVSPDYLEGLQETIEILSDPRAAERIRRTLRRIRAGKMGWYTLEEVFGR